MKRRWLVVASLLLPAAVADVFQIKSEREIAALIGSARQELNFMLPELRSAVIYNAIRETVINSGQLKVRVLADAGLVRAGSNRLAALSLLGLEIKTPPRDLPQTKKAFKVEVRILTGLKSSWLMIDHQKLVRGPITSEAPTIGQPSTWLMTDTRDTQAFANNFEANWQRAKPWMYRIPRTIFRRKQ